MKSWVLLKFVQTNKLGVWRTHEENIWDSPIYEVIGYFDGSFREAMKHGKKLLKQGEE
jgi:hypothetical protein